MSLLFYRLLHIIGAFCVLVPLGAIALHMMNGGTRNYPHRKLMAITHGIGMLLLLVAGFGALAKLGYMSSFPLWAIVKLGLWIVAGVLPVLLYRKASAAKTLFFTVLLIGAIAVYMVEYKPSLSQPSEPSMPTMPSSESQPAAPDAGANQPAETAPGSN